MASQYTGLRGGLTPEEKDENEELGKIPHLMELGYGHSTSLNLIG
jgi:hypothetical protein